MRWSFAAATDGNLLLVPLFPNINCYDFMLEMDCNLKTTLYDSWRCIFTLECVLGIGKESWAAPRLKDAVLSESKMRECYFEASTSQFPVLPSTWMLHHWPVHCGSSSLRFRCIIPQYRCCLVPWALYILVSWPAFTGNFHTCRWYWRCVKCIKCVSLCMEILVSTTYFITRYYFFMCTEQTGYSILLYLKYCICLMHSCNFIDALGCSFVPFILSVSEENVEELLIMLQSI